MMDNIASKSSVILVVDDETHILTILRRTLEMEGFRVHTTGEAEEALDLLDQKPFDLVVTDIMMPGMDGFTLCKNIREFSQIPVILLTAKDSEEDILKGFSLGADDYISKPFSRKELSARVKAVLRRSGALGTPPAATNFHNDHLDINFERRQVIREGKEISLTPTEYRLLQELVINKGKVLTYTFLLQKVWGPEYRDEKQYLHVFTEKLRMKIEPDPSHPQYIQNIFGVGYEFNS